MPPVAPAPPPPAPPRWLAFLADQARQTSTRSGIIFVVLSGTGVTLTDSQTATIMAAAGAIAALYAVIFPDRPNPG